MVCKKYEVESHSFYTTQFSCTPYYDLSLANPFSRNLNKKSPQKVYTGNYRVSCKNRNLIAKSLNGMNWILLHLLASNFRELPT